MNDFNDRISCKMNVFNDRIRYKMNDFNDEIRYDMNSFNDEISCYVYVLRLDKKGFYTGLTNNMERRLKEHRTKRTGYTSKFRIKEIVFLYKLDNRKEARKVEIYIKAVGARKFLVKYEESLRSDTRTKLYIKSLLLTI